MHISSKLISAALLAAAITFPVLAAAPEAPEYNFKIGGIVLLLPERQMAERSNVQELTATIKAVVAGINSWSVDKHVDINECAVFIAIRTEKRLKTWTQCHHQRGNGLDVFLSEHVSASDIASVKTGLIALSVAGAKAGLGAGFLVPSEWQEAINKSGKKSLSIEPILDIVWPE